MPTQSGTASRDGGTSLSQGTGTGLTSPMLTVVSAITSGRQTRPSNTVGKGHALGKVSSHRKRLRVWRIYNGYKRVYGANWDMVRKQWLYGGVRKTSFAFFLRGIRTNAMNRTRAVTSHLILADERFSTARDLPEEAWGSFSYQAVENCQY